MNNYHYLESQFEAACGIGDILQAARLAADLADVCAIEFPYLVSSWARRAVELKIQAAALPN